MRHSAVTRLLESGQPFAVVADIMGWSSATTVRMAKRYGHIGDSVRRRAMTALELEPHTATQPGDAEDSASTLAPQSPTIQ
jgi:integrase